MNTIVHEILAAPLSWFSRRPRVNPRYYVVTKDSHWEIRKYRPFVIVETFVRGKTRERIGVGRDRIQRYLGGENTKKLHLHPSGPSWTAQAEGREGPVEGAWVLSQALPEEFSLDAAPLPLNGNLQLRRIPSLLVASICSSRSSGLSLISADFQRVQRLLAQHPEYQMISEPRLAEFGPENYLGILSRNEIQVTVRLRGYVQ